MENKNKPSKEDIIKKRGPHSTIQEKLNQGLYPTRDEIYQYYITGSHTIQESRKYFNLTVKEWQKIIQFYNIYKNQPTKFHNNRVSLQEKIQQGIYPNKETFEEVYIRQNRSQKETCKYFGFSTHVLNNLVNYYNLHKSKEQNVEVYQKAVFNKYGVKNVSVLPQIKAKIQQTNLRKYGSKTFGESKYFRQSKGYTELGVEILETRLALLEYLTNLKSPITIYDLSRQTNCEYSCLWNILNKWDLLQYVTTQATTSHYEDDIELWLRQCFPNIIVERNRRDLLPSGREIDIYLPDYKVGIEFDGDYWHCERHSKFQDHGGRSHYHQNKSLEAEQQGIFLFHIFEHEWDQNWINKNPKFKTSRENILNRLSNILIKVSKKIPARLCNVCEVTKEEKNLFLEQNHIQGNERAGSYSLGLYYQGQLVSCMCFGHSKYAKYNYELTRFATIHDTIVQGGASKLFNYFVNNKLNIGEKVVSYNDITKTKGDIYKILGFECTSINAPNYWWVNFDTLEVRSRYQEQAAGEVERMHDQGFNRICDCGTKTWVYTK